MTNPVVDLANADCIFVIGSNFAENHPIVARWVMDAKQRGAKLIVADPRYTATAWNADIFLPLMPGTDTSLLNAMMHVIVEEKLYSQKFVNQRTTGFDAVLQLVSEHTPEISEQITRVPADRIIAAARAYATASASSIIYCMGVTQHACGTNTVINCANLAMMCGQIGRPGTGVNPLRGQDNVQGACDMGALPVYYPGYQSVTDTPTRAQFASVWDCAPDDLSPNAGLTLVEIMQAAHHGDIRAMLIMGENPIVVDPNSDHVRAALEHLDFLAIMELFMTETAQLANVILPAASFAEKRGTKTATDRRVQWMERAIAPVGEARDGLANHPRSGASIGHAAGVSVLCRGRCLCRNSTCHSQLRRIDTRPITIDDWRNRVALPIDRASGHADFAFGRFQASSRTRYHEARCLSIAR